MASPPHRLAIFLVALLCAPLAAPASCQQQHHDDNDDSMVRRYERWMAEYGRAYKDEAEKAARFEIFKANVGFIESFNRAGNASHRLGVNAFADMTRDEISAKRFGRRRPPPAMELREGPSGRVYIHHNASFPNIPKSLDWRDRGAVNDVKNQYDCEAAWAFSVVAAVEGLSKIATGKLVSLSEQQLVDCVDGSGCGGGSQVDALHHLTIWEAADGEYNYQYTGQGDQPCREMSYPLAYRYRSYVTVMEDDEPSLLYAVAQQPVAVRVDAGSEDFTYYDSGVFEGPCGDGKQEMTVVGYGEEDGGEEYWILRNSWGEVWGELGYMRMKRGVNMCGIASFAHFPTGSDFLP